MNRRTFIRNSAASIAALSTARMATRPDVPFRGWTARYGRLTSPEGAPQNLCGWRIQIGDAVRPNRYSLKRMQDLAADGLLGNCSAVEIWFGNDNDLSPGEKSVLTPGEYNAHRVAPLVAFMKDLIKAGSYVVPSFRVSYDQVAARANTANGTSAKVEGRPGWCDHIATINNDPVRVTHGPNAGRTYGRHRTRYLNWLDWIIPQLLADPEVAGGIAYWEIWHYPGHRHKTSPGTIDRLIDEMIPAMLEVVRRHDPRRMVGIPLVNNHAVNNMNARLARNPPAPFPWRNDPNWILITGGYGRLDIVMRPDNFRATKTTWPTDNNNPEWLGNAATGEFNITRLRRLSAPYSLHCQEGPGLRETFRLNPIPELQRTWLRGMLNLYNETTNGFGFHAWPPSWANLNAYRFSRPEKFDETDFFGLMRAALKGARV